MKTRIISAAVALALAVVLLALARTWVFVLAVSAITVGALYELFKATGLIKYIPECAACFAFAAVHCMTFMLHRNNFLNALNIKLYGFLFAVAILSLYLKNHEKYVYSVPFTFMGLTLAVSLSFGMLISMVDSFSYGIFALVLTLAGAWLADSGAYFAGTFFGKHKLSPIISPKKTVEGLIGGTLCNGILLLIIAGAADHIFKIDVQINYVGIFIVGMLCSVIGLVGDLAASVIKRQAGIKDYGNIMPGHGGVMDRFDSVLTVTPFMYWLFSCGLVLS